MNLTWMNSKEVCLYYSITENILSLWEANKNIPVRIIDSQKKYLVPINSPEDNKPITREEYADCCKKIDELSSEFPNISIIKKYILPSNKPLKITIPQMWGIWAKAISKEHGWLKNEYDSKSLMKSFYYSLEL